MKWNGLLAPLILTLISWLMSFISCHPKSRHFFVQKKSFLLKLFNAFWQLQLHSLSPHLPCLEFARNSHPWRNVTFFFKKSYGLVSCKQFCHRWLVYVEWVLSLKKLLLEIFALLWPMKKRMRRFWKRPDSVLLICVAHFSFCTAADCHE